MTEETQAKYLSVLRCCGHMGYAALQAAVSAYAVKKERGSNPDFDNAVSFYYWRMKLLDGICSVADGRAASEASHSFPDFATARYQRSVCESRAVESGGRVEGTSALLGLATCAFQRWRVTALCATPFLGVHHSCPRQRPPQSQQCKRERHHHANP